MKVCTKCKEAKPYSEFHKQAASKDSYAWNCKGCVSAYGANKRKDPEFKKRKRENSFRFSYGIDLGEYGAMFERQAGLCAICNKPETKQHPRTNAVMPLSVDHCHSSGKVRGLLCSQCNLMLGLANDDIARLQQAINYLNGGN